MSVSGKASRMERAAQSVCPNAPCLRRSIWDVYLRRFIWDAFGQRLKRRPRVQIRPHDLFARCFPHARMAADVCERRIEPADAVRYADDEGMQADRHHPPRAFTLAVEHVELALDHVLELVDRPVAIVKLWRVVDLVGIGQIDELLAFDVHAIRLIVVHPVRHVLTALFCQDIECIPRLREPRAQPADGFLSRRLPESLERTPDELALRIE